MTRLTAKQVRFRALVTVGMVLVTVALLALGFIYARDTVWFVALLLVIDLPVMVLLAAADRLWGQDA